MSIGATLAGARCRAGLTIADVSARTRIRESVIRAIEQDDFGVCGGDLYAPGYIRMIAAAVGVDVRALASGDDAARPSARPPTAAGLPRSRQRPGRHRRRGPGRRSVAVQGLLALVVLGLVGFTAYKVTGDAASSGHSPALGQGASHARQPGQQSSSAASPVSPAAPAAPVTEVTPATATAFGPAGTSDGDNPQGASLALSGNPATPWHTDWYKTARFGDLQRGTGLLADLGRTVTATAVTIQLGDIRGANLQLRAGTAVPDLPTVAAASDAGGTVRLRLAADVPVRYVLIWFTLLPPDGAGTYQADICDVTVTATA